MKRFTQLYTELDHTTRTAEKVGALVRYFHEAPPLDAAWAMYVLAGRKIGKAVSSKLLRRWASEASGYPDWLVEQSYRVVGDLSETLSLILPAAKDVAPPALHEVIERNIRVMAGLTQETQRTIVRGMWDVLNTEQRFVFHKLISGNFRVGVSRQLLIRALAETAEVPPAVIAHRIGGNWQPDENTMSRIMGKHEPGATGDPGLPYPFMLAHALTENLDNLGPISDWLIEQKWDGIRAQIIRRGEKITLWSRGDEDVTGAFPELARAAVMLPDGAVLDGEIVAWDDITQKPFPFTRLQRRLNRQSVEATFWAETPVTFVAFDLLEWEGRDLRERTLRERREMLSTHLPTDTGLRLSSPVQCGTWDDVQSCVGKSRENCVEGVMLKRWDSTYHAGRPTGLWWKLKVQPFTVDAVLIAAEPGRGRRAGLLTDYTFAVWDNDALVPIAKAYSGLTDVEITEVDRFIRRNTTARHGPVHAVRAERVFEIGFEAIQRSTRHKSGIAVRFPRILRMRSDKTAAEADRLETMRALLVQSEVAR